MAGLGFGLFDGRLDLRAVESHIQFRAAFFNDFRKTPMQRVDRAAYNAGNLFLRCAILRICSGCVSVKVSHAASGLGRTAVLRRAIGMGTVDRILRNLRFDLSQRKVLLVFDEAQHLSIECLETLRELLDQPPNCELLFAGTHELEAIFTRQALELEQWRSRFHAGQGMCCNFSGLLAGDVKELQNGNPTRDLQMAADRTRPHTLCGPVVSSLFSVAARC